MNLSFLISYILFYAIGLVVADNVNVSLFSTFAIDGKVVIPDGSKGSNLKVVLNSGQYETLTRSDGCFTFYLPITKTSDNSIEYPNGIYSVDVLSTHTYFSTMKVKVLVENNNIENSIHVVEYKYPGSKKLPATYPLVMEAILTPNGVTIERNLAKNTAVQKRLFPSTNMMYFQPKKQFNIIGMIMANPMMLMMGAMVLMMIFMPKMLSGLDPEELKKMQAEAGGGDIETDPMKAFQKLMGGGKTDKEEEDD